MMRVYFEKPRTTVGSQPCLKFLEMPSLCSAFLLYFLAHQVALSLFTPQVERADQRPRPRRELQYQQGRLPSRLHACACSERASFVPAVVKPSPQPNWERRVLGGAPAVNERQTVGGPADRLPPDGRRQRGGRWQDEREADMAAGSHGIRKGARDTCALAGAGPARRAAAAAGHQRAGPAVRLRVPRHHLAPGPLAGRPRVA